MDVLVEPGRRLTRQSAAAALDAARRRPASDPTRARRILQAEWDLACIEAAEAPPAGDDAAILDGFRPDPADT